jgi:hypothetical protein
MSNVVHPHKGRQITLGDITRHLVLEDVHIKKILPIWLALSRIRKHINHYKGRARLSLEEVTSQEATAGFPSVELKVYIDGLSICKMMLQSTDDINLRIYLQGCVFPSMIYTYIDFSGVSATNLFFECLFDDPSVNFEDFHTTITNLPKDFPHTTKHGLINNILLSGDAPNGIYKSTFPL